MVQVSAMFPKISAYVTDSKNAHSIAFCNGSELFFGTVQGVPYQPFTVVEDYGMFSGQTIKIIRVPM